MAAGLEAANLISQFGVSRHLGWESAVECLHLNIRLLFQWVAKLASAHGKPNELSWRILESTRFARERGDSTEGNASQAAP